MSGFLQLTGGIMTPEEFVSRLTGVKKNGNGKWMACCPAHKDSDPSLAIGQTNTGKILLRCFAGCSALDVVQSMGLGLEDLFPDAYEENPLAFAQREIAARGRTDTSDDFKITWVAIALNKMRDGYILTKPEAAKFESFSKYLTEKGLNKLAAGMAKHTINHDLSGFIDFNSARYKSTVKMLREDLAK
jgi:DNA primase